VGLRRRGGRRRGRGPVVFLVGKQKNDIIKEYNDIRDQIIIKKTDIIYIEIIKLNSYKLIF
jgi:hypothetical protein